MTSIEFGRIADAAVHLKINHATGAYHKPVALIWALGRAVHGLPRLVAASVVRAELDPLLEELSGAASNAAWPWLKLANDLGPAWTVDGSNPSDDPPADFVAGWSRIAYLEIAENPDLAGQVIEAVTDQYLSEVRETVEAALASEEPEGVPARI